MSKIAEKARLARASVIKLCWPLSFALTLLFCAVLLVLFTNSGKQTVRSSRQCAKEDSFCQVHLSASLRSFFQMWAVAVRFLNAKRSAQRHSFVGIAVRLTIGPLTSLVTYTAVVFLGGYLLTCGDVESNPGPGPGERLDYPWRQPPTRHGTTTDTITRQAACSAGERSANQTRYHSANTTASASGPSGALTRMEAYILQLSDDTAKRLQQMERQQTTLSNTLSNLDTRCQSLQCENDQLKEDVRYLSARCEILQNQAGNLYDWKDHFHDLCQSTDDKVDKLEFFSRRNNVRFFNVYEESDETSEDCVRKVVQLLNRFYSQKVWTRDDVERAHRTGPKSGDINRPRPLIARLHRWSDKISVLQERDGRKAMSDTLNIRVATDLTDRQNNILREEKSAGRQAYFHNGRLCYRERRSPRRSLRSSSKTGSRPHRASHDAPPYPQRTKQPVPSRNGALQDQATPLLSDMEEFPMLHRQTTGDGAYSRPDSQGAQEAQETHQRPIQIATLHRESCVDKRPVAKQCRGPEDSSHRDTRTTTAQTSRDGPGTTAPSSPSRSIDVQPPPHPCPGALLPDRRDLSGECAQPPDRFTRDDEALTNPNVEPLDTQDTDDASAGEGVYPHDAAVDHAMVSADSATPSTARDVSGDERTPWSSHSESPPHYAPQPTGRQENTAASMSGPLTEGTTAQLTSSAEAVDAWDSDQTFAKQLIDPWEAADHIESQPPCSPPDKPQNDNSFELQSMSFEDETIVQTPRQTRSKTKQTRVTDSFFRVDTNLSEKRAGRAKNGLHDS